MKAEIKDNRTMPQKNVLTNSTKYAACVNNTSIQCNNNNSNNNNIFYSLFYPVSLNGRKICNKGSE